jgi:hypothetical protein
MKNQPKYYYVLAHCADGTVLIRPEGKYSFTSISAARKAANDFKGMGAEIEIVEEEEF